MSTTDEEIPSIEEGTTDSVPVTKIPPIEEGLGLPTDVRRALAERGLFATALEAAEGEVRRLREALAKVADTREANGVQSEAARVAQRAISV